MKRFFTILSAAAIALAFAPAFATNTPDVWATQVKAGSASAGATAASATLPCGHASLTALLQPNGPFAQ